MTAPWPDGKQFAFTVFDDTDAATLENIQPVYAFLDDCGLRTTKSVWVVAGDPQRGSYPGVTCEDPDYQRWLLDLQAKGFEIGWHGATWHGIPRPNIEAALNEYSRLFSHYPVTASHHSHNEGMYWGDHRLTGWNALFYNLITFGRNRGKHRGHVEGDEYFWGDLCKRHIKYYRNFIFQDINTLKACPFMPYHDSLRPYVNFWFASSNGKSVTEFNHCLSEENQDRLEAEGGVCIMYTHFASGFHRGGKLDARFHHLMTRLSQKNGWFVPVSSLLDHLQAINGGHTITNVERLQLERKWLREKIFVGTA